MATDFRVRNLIADNTVYNTGNQTISGTKTFNSVISGNINTLFTGAIGSFLSQGAQNNDLLTWNLSSKRFQRAYDGYVLRHDSARNRKTSVYHSQGFLNSIDDYDLGLYDIRIGEIGNTLDIVANVTVERYDLINGSFTYFNGNYRESFLVNQVYNSTFDAYSYRVNNAASAANVVTTIIDQATSKPAAGWVQLCCTDTAATGIDGSLFLRLRSHTSADTQQYYYYTYMRVFIESYESI
jgi:hypothetical protein